MIQFSDFLVKLIGDVVRRSFNSYFRIVRKASLKRRSDEGSGVNQKGRHVTREKGLRAETKRDEDTSVQKKL